MFTKVLIYLVYIDTCFDCLRLLELKPEGQNKYKQKNSPKSFKTGKNYTILVQPNWALSNPAQSIRKHVNFLCIYFYLLPSETQGVSLGCLSFGGVRGG